MAYLCLMCFPRWYNECHCTNTLIGSYSHNIVEHYDFNTHSAKNDGGGHHIAADMSRVPHRGTVL